MPAVRYNPFLNSARLAPSGRLASVNVQFEPSIVPAGVSASTNTGATLHGAAVPSVRTQAPASPTTVSICPFALITATAETPKPGPSDGRWPKALDKPVMSVIAVEQPNCGCIYYALPVIATFWRLSGVLDGGTDHFSHTLTPLPVYSTWYSPVRAPSASSGRSMLI